MFVVYGVNHRKPLVALDLVLLSVPFVDWDKELRKLELKAKYILYINKLQT